MVMDAAAPWCSSDCGLMAIAYPHLPACSPIRSSTANATIATATTEIGGARDRRLRSRRPPRRGPARPMLQGQPQAPSVSWLRATAGGPAATRPPGDDLPRGLVHALGGLRAVAPRSRLPRPGTHAALRPWPVSGSVPEAAGSLRSAASAPVAAGCPADTLAVATPRSGTHVTPHPRRAGWLPAVAGLGPPVAALPCPRAALTMVVWNRLGEDKANAFSYKALSF